MPRTGRIVLPGFPHHVRQEDHNGQVLFACDADFRTYLDVLVEWKGRLGCELHSFCFMTNHTHLVINPGEDGGNLALLMKRVAAKYTRYVNRVEGRSGTVWNGRYRSTPVDTDSYLLQCSRYVDLNPVRAGLVMRPEDYPWSSFRARAGLIRCDWLDHDPCYVALGPTPERRAEHYRSFVADEIPVGEWDLIRDATRRGQLVGTSRFTDEIEQRIGRRVELRGRGRPREKGDRFIFRNEK